MKAALVTVLGGFVATPLLSLSVLLGMGGESGATVGTYVSMCLTSGPVSGLSDVQARNARLIVAAVQQAGIAAGVNPSAQDDAEVIALMTAAAESALHNYASPLVAGSEAFANDGFPSTGGDHDSVGLFQQRASWGSLAQRMNPVTATQLFAKRLFEASGWYAMPRNLAAQVVQVSARPDRYAHFEQAAEAWLADIVAAPGKTIGCGGHDTGVDVAVPPGKLPPGYEIPVDAADVERKVVTFALAQLGKPYVFGSAGPDTYDCSGLMLAAWRSVGVDLPHYTVAQFALGVPIASLAVARPGDLIFIPGSDGSLVPPNPQHVGMYIGHGFVVEAPQAGEPVKVVPAASFGPVIGIRRYG